MINLPGAEEIVTTVVAERILQLQLEELIPKHGLKMPKLADEGGSDPLLDNLVHHPLNQLDAQLSEQLVRRFPSTCQRKYTCKLLLENDAQEQVDVFPLSILLHFCPSLSLIQAVHKACPMALHCKLGQHQGLRPLDIACARSASLDVIEFLHSQDPAVVALPNSAGWYPLHYACRQGSSSSPKVLTFLLEHCPQAARATEQVHGSSPLHLAVLAGADVAILEQLHSLWPQSALSTDDQGRTPLHLACRYPSVASVPVVHFLLKVAPEALSVVSLGGWTPKQLASCCQMPAVLDLLKQQQRLPSASWKQSQQPRNIGYV